MARTASPGVKSSSLRSGEETHTLRSSGVQAWKGDYQRRIGTYFGVDLLTLRSLELASTNALRGKTNNTDRVTLAAGATTTTVTEPLCTALSAVLLSPESATAAAAVGSATGVYVTPGEGSFVVTHTNTADTDRTFSYAVVA